MSKHQNCFVNNTKINVLEWLLVGPLVVSILDDISAQLASSVPKEEGNSVVRLNSASETCTYTSLGGELLFKALFNG